MIKTALEKARDAIDDLLMTKGEALEGRNDWRELYRKFEQQYDWLKRMNSRWIALACNHQPRDESDTAYVELTNETAIALLRERISVLEKLPPAAFVGDTVALDEETEA